MDITQITPDALTALAVDALMAYGVLEQDAQRVARILVLADMMKLHTHGVSRLVSYCERLRIGGIDPAPQIRTEAPAPAIRRIDGGNGLGPLVGMRALDAAMEAARETGIAMAICCGSSHFGPIAPYAWIAAAEGFASMIGSNASVTIAPTGGREARLGNNPLGFGFPDPEGEPVILDMAMSVVARAKIRDAAAAGEPIPDSWATDDQGRPTTDPVEALKGCLLPFGGYKGYGLSLCVDLMSGLLSGAAYLTHVSPWVERPEAPQDLGHIFVLIDTARLLPAADLHDRMQDFGSILHSATTVDTARPVLLPGEREIAHLRRAEQSGIGLPRATFAKVDALIQSSRTTL